MQLPIDDVLGDIVTTLASHTSLVLQAPPGAGKTTRVPPALLSADWLQGRKLIMLEPRRLAARAAATFMARQLGETVGQTVGYRIRFDTRVSRRTRIEVVTEGVLTRIVQSDAALEEYGVVIFDEFHERSLHADLGLALTLQSRALLRPDLRLLVMSATLDGEAVARLLDDAPIITSEGRSYPVETIFTPRAPDVWLEHAVKRVVLRALAETDGDVLVFLPGAGEIHRTLDALMDDVDRDAYVVPLYGNLTQAEQDRAIAPSLPGKRKVVLATSIAETSLTIEGVRTVIDSGLMRVPRFDARTGMTRLETITVTRASADQRRGRAGRMAAGTCYRMWSQHDDRALVPFSRPEILEADLAPLALDLAAWGIADPQELAWLDAPAPAAIAQARELLFELGALDEAGAITEHGRRMNALPTHPRLAHMLLKAQQLGATELACGMAALLSERVRVDRIDERALAGVRREAEQFGRLLAGLTGLTDLVSEFNVATSPAIDAPDRHGGTKQSDPKNREPIASGATLNLEHWSVSPVVSPVGTLLAFAYPDRLARNRGSRGKFLLRNGRGAVLDEAHPHAGEDFIVAAVLEGSGRDSRIFLSAPISEAAIREHFAEQIQTVRSVELTPSGSAQAIVREQLGAIVLRETAGHAVEPEELADVLLADIIERGLDTLPWSRAAAQLRERIAFMHALDASWPDVSFEALATTARDWLLPQLHGLRSRAAVERLDMHEALAATLDWQQRQQLERLAPTHLVVPTGSHIHIDYSDPNAPFAAVRLQEVFGMKATPRLGGDRVPLTLHLLSPAQRPVQVTRDLASFWENGYFEVKKELKGRYPKHYWPDDPLIAEAVRGTKRRRT